MIAPPPTTVELILRGIAVGAMAATLLGMWRSDVSKNAKIAISIFCVFVSGYVMDAYGRASALGLADPVCWFLDAGVPACVWMVIMVIFEDRKVSPLLLAPMAVQIGLDAWGVLTHQPPSHISFVLRDVISVVLGAHALFLVVRGWRGDLVEDRRRLRGPLLATTAGYVIVQTILDALNRNGAGFDWLPLFNAAAMALLTSFGSSVFLQGREAIFGVSRLAQDEPKAAPALEDAGLSRLLRAMDDGLWRQEGLTIAALASAVDAPEHRVRRLIHDRLGHRNFADFVNSRRIEAAKAALADPAQARTTVAVIAYEHGFSSLGPFNRAFKAATGVSPREWRAQQQADATAAE